VPQCLSKKRPTHGLVLILRFRGRKYGRKTYGKCKVCRGWGGPGYDPTNSRGREDYRAGPGDVKPTSHHKGGRAEIHTCWDKKTWGGRDKKNELPSGKKNEKNGSTGKKWGES